MPSFGLRGPHLLVFFFPANALSVAPPNSRAEPRVIGCRCYLTVAGPIVHGLIAYLPEARKDL